MWLSLWINFKLEKCKIIFALFSKWKFLNKCYPDIVDIKPANMEELTEVITAAEFHPNSCNTFVYSSSKGTIRLCDMRASALCDRHSKRKCFLSFFSNGNIFCFLKVASGIVTTFTWVYRSENLCAQGLLYPLVINCLTTWGIIGHSTGRP